MPVNEIAILTAAFSGFCMVIGGMLLIWKGAITLAGTDSTKALSIEWKQDLKLSTQAPGIAFFLVGLIFTSVAIYFSKPEQTDPIYISGKIENISEQVTVTAMPLNWVVKSGTNGKIEGKFSPDIEILALRFTAPGYNEEVHPHKFSDSSHKITLTKPIQLIKAIDEIKPSNANIIPIPKNLPPLTSVPSFGT
ncbi:hypothetical protein [Neptunomonas qingdaonensis]|uniref:Uncharacterized protein n=1 Tax=Neptunomonas qingdaonensis TaxID=1045558 RepID=A0A1I2Q6L8_9GAMM|nr:hypothetical protein [Neptunomonas qingdaonensis]SFG23580.1 hypothetical protein SAMN05216175_104243 [Neptunomonas qingdaonensis]